MPVAARRCCAVGRGCCTRAVDAAPIPPRAPRRRAGGQDQGPAEGRAVDAALAEAATGRLRLDDGRVGGARIGAVRLVVRDAALARCAALGTEGAEQLWAALTRETPDPEAAEPAALLAACALLRGDGALAGIALDRAEQAWPGHGSPGCCARRGRRGCGRNGCASVCARPGPTGGPDARGAPGPAGHAGEPGCGRSGTSWQPRAR